MSETTQIPWCDSTINDWEGCTKVSPGCLHCYAEALDRRMRHEKVIHWGAGAPRRKSKSATKQRAALNRKPWVCDNCGNGFPATMHKGDFEMCSECLHSKNRCSLHRRRIFSLSLGDWLDPEVPIEWLAEMLDSIRLAPDCYHLLCTKRPELFFERLRAALNWHEEQIAPTNSRPLTIWLHNWIGGHVVPSNLWIGATCEDQKRADERIPRLMEIPARVRFLSCEPLLGNIDLKLAGPCDKNCAEHQNAECPGTNGKCVAEKNHIDWVIVGGESGPKARPCNVEWIRSVRIQCQAANVPVFVKQLGARPVEDHDGDDFELCDSTGVRELNLKHPKGGEPAEWPEDLRIRQFPQL